MPMDVHFPILNFGDAGMGAQARPLVIGDVTFGTRELADLEQHSGLLAGAVVVRTLADLERTLSQTQFSLVLHVCSKDPSAIPAKAAMQAVQHFCCDVPYVAIGENLPASCAVELFNAGAADCLVDRDDRTIGDVVENAVGPYRHLRLMPESGRMVPNSRQMLEAIGEGIIALDVGLRIQSINPAFQTLSGYTPDELVHRAIGDLDAGDQERRLETCQQGEPEWRGEVRIRRKDGSAFPAWAVMSPVPSALDDASIGGHVLLISDISQRKVQEEELIRQANFDSLTQLPNRSLLQDRAVQMLAAAKRNETYVAAMFVDLDHFKEINDTWGHANGDALLVEAAARMQACVRESDTVARIGGDEFAVLLADVRENHFVEKVASKIAGALERPFVIEGVASYLSGSIGIAIYPLHGTDPDTLFANADAAMYEVKRNGRRGYRLYGDTAPVSSTVSHVADAAVSGQERPPKQGRQGLSQMVARVLAKKVTLPVVSLFPAGLATACLLLLFGWLVASGSVNLPFTDPDALLTGTELNGFGTASGPEDVDSLPDSPQPELDLNSPVQEKPGLPEATRGTP